MFLKGGQVVVESLAAHGVDLVFGIPGGHTLEIYDALYNHRQIRHILARHEQGAGYMADGYARATGRPGVALTVTGPGALNAITPVACAYADSSPVLLINSQIARAHLGKEKGSVHEIDTLTAFRSATAWNRLLPNVEDIAPAIDDAFRHLAIARPRPIQLEIPTDTLAERADVAIPVGPAYPKRAAPADAVTRAAQLIRQARQPAIWVGNGTNRAGATAALSKLAERLQSPVFSSTLGKGALPDDHPLSLGLRWLNEPSLESILTGADLLIAVGTRFAANDTRNWTLPLPKTIIQIDLDPAEIGKNYPATVGLIGDARIVIEQLDVALTDLSDRPERGAEVRALRQHADDDYRARYPREMGIVDTLRRHLERDAIVCAGSLVQYWIGRHFPTLTPGGVQMPWNLDALGFCYPAAVGAKAGLPNRQVVSICGDGGFLFTCQEIATAVQHEINVVAIVLNDDCYAAMRRQQTRRFGGRSIAADLSHVDFAAMGESMGALGMKLDRVEQLDEALPTALRSNRPVVIDVPCTLDLPWL